jgi:FkbM family methyltransferase
MYQQFRWTKIAENRISILKDYEPIQPYVLVELARRTGAGTFIDIGANIGVYSIFMASLECIKSVHAFEPSPATFAELSRNVSMNDSGKVRVYRTALSDSSRSLNFGIVSDFSGANSIVEGSIHAPTLFSRAETVAGIALDDAGIEAAGKLCVKLDVEGHEKNVLLGARTVLTRGQTILQMENYKEDVSIEELLRGYGFRLLFRIGPDHYYTNTDELSSADVVGAFERAAKALIAANFEYRPVLDEDPRRPIGIKLLPGLKVEISGAAASLARRAKHRLRGRQT